MSETVTNAQGGKQSKLAERSDLVPPAAFLAVAEVLARGAAKYGEDNWKLITVNEHLNHAITHVFQHLAGDKGDGENHLVNAACRMLMAVEVGDLEKQRPGRRDVGSLPSEIARLEAMIHPWYGPCDGLGENGGCSECQKIKQAEY